MLKKSGKKKNVPQKYVLVMIAIVLFVSALSVWCIIPQNTMKSSLTIRTYDANVECFAQGDYTPKPLETTKFTPIEDNDEAILLCGAQGDYKPKPLKPTGD
jgi:hypothetical protein